MTNETMRVQLEVEFYPAKTGVDWVKEVREKVGLRGGWLRVREVYHDMECDEVYGVGSKSRYPSGETYTTVECEYYPGTEKEDEPRV